MKMRQLLFVIALVAPMLAQSNPPTFSPGLEAAKIFALGPVGYAAKTSQEERQFRAIMALQPDKAKQELERIYSSGNPQAMAYALVGMRKFDRTRYAELVASALVSDVTVRTMSGCIISEEKLSTIAIGLDSEKYDPLLP